MLALKGYCSELNLSLNNTNGILYEYYYIGKKNIFQKSMELFLIIIYMKKENFGNMKLIIEKKLHL